MIKLSYIYNPHMFKIMENHPLKKKHDVTERIYFSFKRFEVFHFFYMIWHLVVQSDSYTHHAFPEEDCTAELHL